MAAKKKVTKKTAQPSNLVKMVKGEEVLYVNPKCVDEHLKLGWSRG